MTIRTAQRPLDRYAVVRGVEIAVGATREGVPLVSIRPGGSRSGVQNISDPDVVRQLIADLTEALPHLEAPGGE